MVKLGGYKRFLTLLSSVLLFSLILSSCSYFVVPESTVTVDTEKEIATQEEEGKDMESVDFETLALSEGTDISHKEGESRIVLAGGCFWGTEHFLKQLPGVTRTFTAYANGKGTDVDYLDVSSGTTGHAEAVFVSYNPEQIDLKHLLYYFFRSFNPTQKNRQGNDVGTQYRNGIYYLDDKDLPIIKEAVKKEQERFSEPLQTEIEPLKTLVKAEDYHQNYLTENPNGYCHVDFRNLPPEGTPLTDEAERAAGLLPKEETNAKDSNESKDKEMPLENLKNYKRNDDTTLQSELDPKAYNIALHAATEAPFTSPLNSETRDGIYVDKTSGQPLFCSKDKFDSGCGWPSFSKPIDDSLVTKHNDNSFGMERIEVRSDAADIHLGHVFNDGPEEMGGHRYCINGAILKFVPKEDMEKEGYGYLLFLFDQDK